jgi:cytochrome b pre-mRNA-processing protein 3
MLGAKVAPLPPPVNRRSGQSIAMIFQHLFANLTKKRGRRTPAECLYAEAVRQARTPAFFGTGRIPDTVEGRFEALALHGFLVLHRLKQEGDDSRPLAQQFFDVMFTDLDRNLREIGIGDLAVGKRIKLLAENFYGRIMSYEDGLTAEAGALELALARNLLIETATAKSAPVSGPLPPFAMTMAAYLRAEAEALEKQPYRQLAEGAIDFVPPSFEALQVL